MRPLVLAGFLVLAGACTAPDGNLFGPSSSSSSSSSSTSSAVSSTGAPVCAPGDQHACACPGQGNVGAQVCKANGSGWGPCMGCGGGASSTASTSSAGGGGGGGGVGGGAASSSASATGGMTGAGGGIGSGVGGGAVSCANPIGCNACQLCAQAGACAAQWQACQTSAQGECLTYIDCMNGCAGNAPCIENCGGVYPQGLLPFEAYAGCMCPVCATQCAAAPIRACGGGVGAGGGSTVASSASSSGGGCGAGQFACKDGDCIPSFEECNGTPNCPDGSDEKPANPACP